MKHTHPVTIIIFGGTGDLAEQKLVPALSDLYQQQCLPDTFFVVGFSRKVLLDADYQSFIEQSLVKKNKTVDPAFIQTGRYVQGDLTSVDSYHALATYLHTLDESMGVCSNKLFYLAVPPALYETVFTNLAASGLTLPCKTHARDDAWTRLLVEKPFGDDEQHAKHLDATLGTLFLEEQVFRIDHYVAKETLQNILTFRFKNALFESLWNAAHIARVDIEMYESFDIKKRGSFYDAIGSLKDVGQNHLLQILALIAMDAPETFDADAIRTARTHVLQKLTIDGKPEDALLRGQYTTYRQTPGVAEHSTTETYFSARLQIDTERWRGVPFYIRHGKTLHETATRIKVTYKPTASIGSDTVSGHNVITFAVQPNEGISITFFAKRPGFVYATEEKTLTYMYPIQETRLPDAYERVLYDALRGDQTLFISTEEIMAQWRLTMDILSKWNTLPLHMYEPGVHPDTIGGTIEA